MRLTFDDQDFFNPDPVRYQSALGEKGLAAYRAGGAAARTGRSCCEASAPGEALSEYLALVHNSCRSSASRS